MNKDINMLCNEYVENKAMIDEISAMNESIKSDIIALMKDNDTVYTGGHKVTYKSYISNRIDTKVLKISHPKIYKECIKESSYKKFIVA